MPVLETDRLLLRPFVEDDLDAYAAMLADPEVTRFLGDGSPSTREDAWRSMATLLGHERLRGWTMNAVVERDGGRVVGRCGLWRPEGWPGLEVGWTLARASWGRGYATEAAAAWRDWAFDVLGADEVVSLIDPANVRSVAVAERLGHRHLRDVELHGRPVALYGQQADGRRRGT